MSNQQVATIKQRQQAVAAIFDGEQRTELASMLAPGVSVDRFVRTFKNALARDPQIAEASQRSIFLECQKAAQDGLVLDGREAVLTRFNRSVKKGNAWEKIVDVVYIPMVTGIMKRARNTGQISSWSVALVHEAEVEQGRFVYQAGDNPHIKHEPMIVGDRGPVVAAYSSVRLTDGTYHHEVMTIEEINSIMNRTKSKKSDGTITGPWASDWAEMAKKTVIRRHAKRLPMSGTDFAVAERIDALYDFEAEADGVYADPVSPSARNKRRTSAAERLKEAEAEEPEIEPEAAPEPKSRKKAKAEPEPEQIVDYDPETGEIAEAAPSGDINPEDEF